MSRLGRLLKAIERAAGPGRGKIHEARDSFMAMLKKLSLPYTTAQEAQRIAELPESEFEKALERARSPNDPEKGFLSSFTYLLREARPYWYAEPTASAGTKPSRPRPGLRRLLRV